MAMGRPTFPGKRGPSLPSGPWKPCGEMGLAVAGGGLLEAAEKHRQGSPLGSPCRHQTLVIPADRLSSRRHRGRGGVAGFRPALSAGSGAGPVDELTRTQGLRQGLDEGLDFIANSAVVFQGLFFRLRRRR